ncbi:unnamed protein product [Psylliodes chrysocephalus]|uniref:Uncharacterized protein n=1 Tax=Psylliodes chrysocephalus TaxID=3402493 RepID=A0A9P0D6D6_9CUCU|nr:unnamed protein product [Psylliodes chrysocephala]
MQRHDCIVKAVGDDLVRKGWSVTYEKRFITPVGTRKPDICARKGNRYAVIDAQVVAVDGLDGAHRRKVAKYRDEAHLAPIIVEEFAQTRNLEGRRMNQADVSFCSVSR